MNKILGFGLITIGGMLVPTAFIVMFYMLVLGVYDLYLMFVNQSLTFNGLLWAIGLIALRELVAAIIFITGVALAFCGIQLINKV